jgi:hypothetical protein
MVVEMAAREMLLARNPPLNVPPIKLLLLECGIVGTGRHCGGPERGDAEAVVVAGW